MLQRTVTLATWVGLALVPQLLFTSAAHSQLHQRQLIVEFHTGGDDLRGGNDNLNVVVLRQHAAPQRLANVNHGHKWPNNSTNAIFIDVATLSDIIGIRLEFTASGGAGGDNWNLDRLVVKAKEPDRIHTLFDSVGSSLPLVRLTGDNRMAEFLFAAGEAPPSPPVRTAFAPTLHGFKFANRFKNLTGVFDITTGGLCGGMVYAALDYYYAHKRIPQQTYMPAEGTRLQSYLYTRNWNEIERNLHRWGELGFNPAGARNREIFGWGLQVGSGRLGEMMASIDRGRPIPLSLQMCGDDCACRGGGGGRVDCPGNHVVLAIGYELGRYRGIQGEHPEDVRIFIYDPNVPGQTLTLRADATNAWYFEEERPDGRDRRWRAYFADNNYSVSTPPTIPDQEIALIIEFQTGGDDLRGGNDNVDVIVNRNGLPPVRFGNVNKGKRWKDGTSQTVALEMTTSARHAADLAATVSGVRLVTSFGGGGGGDNWDLDWIGVSARVGNETCSLLQRGRRLRTTTGVPLFRFTGDQPALDLAFVAGDRGCP